MISVPARGRRRQSADRPTPCRLCDLPAWWNGTRTVGSVRKTSEGVEHATNVVRRRARCCSSDCPAKDWTVYEDGAYPHRLFQLDVVADAVIEAETTPMAAVASTHACSRDSVRRWRRWVATLADPRDLRQLNARLDPDGVVVALPASSPAAVILRYLERLADLVLIRGVPLPRAAAGLTRLLRHQLDRFGDVFHLTKFSPPLRADLLGAGL